MKRAALALALVLVACSQSANDFPSHPGGAGPGGSSGGNPGGIVDGGIDGILVDAGDAGVPISGRVCIVKDLRTPAVCDTTKDASVVKVTLGTRTPTAAPAKTGEFTIIAELGTALVWHATGTNFVPSVMPYGITNVIPIVPDLFYQDLQNSNAVATLPEGQGAVLARVVTGTSPAAGVNATSTLISGNEPLFDANDPQIWGTIGPTKADGAIWFAGVNVTTAATITFTRPGPPVSAPVTAPVTVEDQSITFITQDVP
jgi:hypothetical protein